MFTFEFNSIEKKNQEYIIFFYPQYIIYLSTKFLKKYWKNKPYHTIIINRIYNQWWLVILYEI